MKACEQKKCLHYDTNAIGNCNAENIYCDAKNYQENRKLRFIEQYHELIMAVESKYPNESRHETALRYIRERENKSFTGSEIVKKSNSSVGKEKTDAIYSQNV